LLNEVGVGNDGVDDDAVESAVAAELVEENGGGGGRELGFLNESGVVVVSVLVDALSGLTIETDLDG